MKEAGRPKNVKAMAKQGAEAMKEAGRPKNVKAMAKQGVEIEKKMAKDMMEAGRPKNVKEMFGGVKKSSAAAKESLLELGAAVEDHREVQFPRAKDMKEMARQGAEAEQKMAKQMAESFSPKNMKAVAKQGVEVEKKMAEEHEGGGEAGR